MIAYMDFSFEKAFEKREKDFMVAYRVWIINNYLIIDRATLKGFKKKLIN